MNHFSKLMTSGNITPIALVNWEIGYKEYELGRASWRYRNRDVLTYFRHHNIYAFDNLLIHVKRELVSTMRTQLRIRLKELGAL